MADIILNVTQKTPQAYETDSYQSKTLHQHVLDRGFNYIGGSKRVKRDSWVCQVKDGVAKMVKKNITVSKGEERLGLEMTSNAGDNVERSRKNGINPGVIKITIEGRTISVWNSGIVIPVDKNDKGKWVPSMIFGELLTSSNYDDTVERKEAGVNGLGIKLVNIYSTKFKVTIGDPVHKRHFTQTWTQNMFETTPPTIQNKYNEAPFVMVEAEFDLSRFGGKNSDSFSEDMIDLFRKHAIDLAYLNGIVVQFNTEKYHFTDDDSFARMYFGDVVQNSYLQYVWPDGTATSNKKVGNHKISTSSDPKVSPILKILLVDTPNSPVTISYVNGMMTPDGGLHVEKVYKAYSDHICSAINGKEEESKTTKGKDTSLKNIKVTMTQVKQHLSLLVVARVANPEFNSQSKSSMESCETQIKVTVPSKFMKSIDSWGMIEALQYYLRGRIKNLMKASDGKKTQYVDVKKAQDAIKAGTEESSNCTLIISEGDSSINFVEAWIGCSKDRWKYLGAMPIRGKLINTLNASPGQLINNNEISNIKKILGLREDVDYSKPANLKTLRYGGLLIMADADVDGFHILLLIVLYFHVFFPSLLRSGFVSYYRSAIIRCDKGKQVLRFYTENDYEEWKEKTPNWNTWNVEYNKGLGGTGPSTISDEFKNTRLITCLYDDTAPDTMDLAFNKKRANDRKRWLEELRNHVSPKEDLKMKHQPISELINNDLLRYAFAALERAIPNFADGFKDVQRKSLWGVIEEFKVYTSKNPVAHLTKAKLIKTDQAALIATKITDYGHGATSMLKAMVLMTQDFAGTNNIPYFKGKGMFGSREGNGQNAADPRYTHLRPQKWIPLVYRPEDIPLYKYNISDDGDKCEPKFGLPIIPMILVNGAQGIATGYSTTVPSFNPTDIVKWYLNKLQGRPVFDLIPWYRYFKGTITLRKRDPKTVKEAGSSDEMEAEEDIFSTINSDGDTMEVEEVTGESYWEILGNYEESLDGKVVRITELPVGRSAPKYKEWIMELKKEAKITGYEFNSRTASGDEDQLDYTIFNPTFPINFTTLCLRQTISPTNLVLLDNKGWPRRFKNINEILEYFYEFRLGWYKKRYSYLISNIEQQISKLEMKYRFIELVINGKLGIFKRAKKDVTNDMTKLGFTVDQINKLINMPVSRFTADDLEVLKGKISTSKKQLSDLKSLKPSDLWVSDLQEFSKNYPEIIESHS